MNDPVRQHGGDARARVRRTARRRSRVATVALVGLATLTTSSCSLLGLGGPKPEDAAAALARALSRGNVGSVPFAGLSSPQAQARWKAAVGGLGQATPRVSVVSVSKSGDHTRDARLSYSWRLPGAAKPWTYRTTARLTQADSGAKQWRTRFSPTLVHPDLRDGERLVRATTFATRADILGAGGTHLVTARPVLRFGIDKTTVAAGKVAPAARALARLLHVDAAAYLQRVEAAGRKAFVEAIVLRGAEARAALRAGAGRVAGARVVHDTLPLAPSHDFARAVLGTVGPVDAAVVKASKGVYAAGDEAGLTGLEGRYDEQLRGTPGVRVSAVDPKGTARRLLEVAPRAGAPLRTTLDRRLQALAERSLQGVHPASALVAVRPSTGDLLAVANGAGSGGLSTATVGHYAPGSTFKVASSLALLRAGVKPTTVVSCPASTVVNGKRFKNYSDYPAAHLGRITLATAVANSCNTAFIGERGVVSQAQLADAAAALGVGVDHDLGFPAYFGSVPASDEDAGGETGHAASLIGQGRVVASPMAMATVAASVARGSTVVPRLLPARTTDDKRPTKPLTSAEAGRLRTLMRGVVTQGSGALLASVPGKPVLAKTGTAEFGDKAPYRTHTWMIAVHGDLAVAVFVDVGSSGAGTAGPILKQFLLGAG